MTESCDQDGPMADHSQVVARNLVSPRPCKSPQPGPCMVHVDDVIEGWDLSSQVNDRDTTHGIKANQPNELPSTEAAKFAAKEEVSDVSDDDNASDDDSSQISEDAISVLARVSVEEAVEGAVREVQSPEANQDSMEAIRGQRLSRPPSILGESQHYHDDHSSVSSEEDEEDLPYPSLPHRPSGHSPHLANRMQPGDHCDKNDDDDDDESKSRQEVTTTK